MIDRVITMDSGIIDMYLETVYYNKYVCTAMCSIILFHIITGGECRFTILPFWILIKLDERLLLLFDKGLAGLNQSFVTILNLGTLRFLVIRDLARG